MWHKRVCVADFGVGTTVDWASTYLTQPGNTQGGKSLLSQGRLSRKESPQKKPPVFFAGFLCGSASLRDNLFLSDRLLIQATDESNMSMPKIASPKQV